HLSQKYKIPFDYYVMAGICGLLVIFAFATNPPMDVLRGFWYINTSRSVLVTDYVALAGLSATLLNSAVSCGMFLILLIKSKSKPNGKIIAALFLTLGFAMFGKNIVNSLPLCFGVWCYAKANKARVRDYLVYAITSSTISPIVSEIAFATGDYVWWRMAAAYAVGVFIGFIFPAIAETVKRMHIGYCLYNSGIAGGFIATFAAGIFRSIGHEVRLEEYWDTQHTTILAIGAFSFSVAVIIFGLFSGGPRAAISKYMRIIKEKDRDNNDYFTYYGSTCYINIGVMCIVATATMLLLGIPINGPVLGAIITIAGFAVAGKHLRNTIPILAGSILAAHLNAYFNDVDVTTTAANALAILFATGLAPISCKYGPVWGIIVGFMHVSVAIYIGDLNGGLNLYNNGFAGGFVAIAIVPLIMFFNKIVLKKTETENQRRRSGD
ncbi:MAG: DUF1576 domain-containing protein, partial [Oscillospiraceae bacterium]|nr:DUF1576 domain-containing protein [Oscillospiraceae bacterium]